MIIFFHKSISTERLLKRNKYAFRPITCEQNLTYLQVLEVVVQSKRKKEAVQKYHKWNSGPEK